jgi:regulator of sigma E protease
LPTLLLSIIAFLLVLGPLIFIHELGHFLVAKWLGIRVEVFSLGFGKRLFGFRRGDTDYRVSALPLGGYVKMAGENIGEERVGAPDEFLSHSKWHRFLVAVAGPVMNLLVALAIPAVAAMIFFQTEAYKEQVPVVAGTAPRSAAANAGLRPGDRILSVDGSETDTWRDLEDQVMINPGRDVSFVVERGGQAVAVPVKLDERTFGGEKIGTLGARPDLPGARVVVAEVLGGSVAEAAGLRVGDEIYAVDGERVGADQVGLVSKINDSAGKQLTITVKRDGQLVDLQATPAREGNVGRIGFIPSLADVPMIETRLGLGEALAYSWETNMRFIRLTGAAFAQIFEGNRSVRESFAGPIGIAKISGQAAQHGIGPLFDLMGMLSLNLGIFNLLPIPVLDGGLIFMLALEALLGLFGLRLSMVAKERMINVGLVLIMLLMGFVIFNDISKQFVGTRTSEQPPAQQPAPER